MVFNENLLPTLLSVNRAGLDDIFDLVSCYHSHTFQLRLSCNGSPTSHVEID